MSAARRRSPSRAPSFDLGEVFGESFRILGRRFPALFTITFLVSLPIFVLGAALFFMPEAFGEAGVVLASATTLIALLVLGPVSTGAATKVVVGQLTGRSVGVGEALGFGFRRFLPLLGVSIIVGLVVFVGSLFLVIPGLLFMTWFYVAVPAVVAEEKSPFEAMSRSRELIRGNGWGVFGLIVLLVLIQFGVNFAGGFVLGVLGMTSESGDPVGMLVEFVIDAVVTSLTVAAPAVAYFRLRSGKDGIEVRELASLVDRIGREGED